ncbi:flagellar biosynthesis protein FlgN [Epibacterium ulvae]|uniref:flagellar biosynthesis protein FlgN n=1 Tax=Epibacterium ulvae TaxID=1156985 RepID=UPI001BFC7F72|nr:flagellar biosynthesis protein FlgN [Epibacterium ulvae]MBT8155771.1 flagellar biosynthesis protein FlgN [Epibacterium ulvae]
MTDLSAQEQIDELDDILEQEREALVLGHLTKLEALLERKGVLIEGLNALNELEREALESVHNKVSRNQALLDSAMQGIRAVAARMQELRRVRSGLDVYDQAGRKNSFSTASSMKLEKRA